MPWLRGLFWAGMKQTVTVQGALESVCSNCNLVKVVTLLTNNGVFANDENIERPCKSQFLHVYRNSNILFIAPYTFICRWSEFVALLSLSTTFFLFLQTRTLSYEVKTANRHIWKSTKSEQKLFAALSRASPSHRGDGGGGKRGHRSSCFSHWPSKVWFDHLFGH